mmetsp:Transcript_16014/g.29044  ORF Transcript_16014/g.29044 Transcript_16014/m.29044 type:complete len:148 (+) Transcript_16014:1126-1569(+)
MTPNFMGFFFGEEVSMAARLYTHGIDLYAPPQTICYHLWKRNPFRVSGKVKQREDSLQVVRMQLRGMGRGLGTVRSMKQFWEELGVDFEKQTLAPGCENAGLSGDAFVYPTSLGRVVEDKAEACNGLIEIPLSEDMSSILNLVGQFM